MDLQFAPHLVEAVVRHFVDRDLADARATYLRLYNDLVRLNLDRDPSRQESLNRYLFLSLGLDQPIGAVAAEFPGVSQEVHVGTASRSEGCFLVPPQGAVLVRLHPARFENAERLTRFLRNEWRHLADMKDPAFGYPEAPPDLDPPSRDRYALLWHIYVDARTAREGRQPMRGREQWKEEFDRYWAHVDDPGLRARAFERFWQAEELTHPELIDMGRDPHLFIRRYAGVAGDGRLGGRCPLCGFPTFHWVLNGRLKEAVAARIRADFRHWDPSQGACERCVELYEIRAGLW
ncbi:MAG: hypothetical protein HY716_17395 [Planctomycetes bacterium]|nr:hypothetical protein [Planctomycetota bacterium]